jgi:hypothetical protein
MTGGTKISYNTTLSTKGQCRGVPGDADAQPGTKTSVEEHRILGCYAVWLL